MEEENIRPKKLFNDYLNLAKIDGEKFFPSSKLLKFINCPSCDSVGNYIFTKHNSIYVNPRSTLEDLFNYYENSDSALFFGTEFYRLTQESRRELLWKPKAIKVLKYIEDYKCLDADIYDVGGGYGVFAEEFFNISNIKINIIEPSRKMASICREKGFEVIESFIENINHISDNKKVLVSFELFEHLHDTNYFLSRINKLLNKGDLFLFTSLSSLGFDIRLLWEESNSFSVQHLNFFNPKSIKNLLYKNGFNIINIETPGKLDIDIVKNNLDKIKNSPWKVLIESLNIEESSKWQEIISNSNLSSHMWVLAKKD